MVVPIRKAALLVLACLGFTEAASAVLIDFDGLPPGDALTNQFQSDGVLFDGAWVHDGLSASRGSPPNWISGEMPPASTPGSESNPSAISGYFVNPSNLSQDTITDYFEALSAFVDSDTTVFLDVFNLAGALIASASRTGSSGILSISAPNIHGFSLYHANSGFNGIDEVIGFDNVVFNSPTVPVEPPTVPEPTTTALLVFGLLSARWRVQ